MDAYTLDTTLFGEIEITQSNGLFEDFDIILGGKSMTVTLNIVEDVATDNAMKIVEDMLNNIPIMYEKGKKVILDGKDSNALIESFISLYFSHYDIGSYLDFFGVDSKNGVTTTMIAERLEPRTISIGNDKDSMIDCTFDFSLPPEYTDQLLVIRFDEKNEICFIAHES